MANSGPTTVTPGWYPDPIGRFELRFYNGREWTADVSTAGDRFVDPLGIRPPEVPATRSTDGNGTATASMVLGIVAVTIAWLPFVVVVGVVVAIVALALGWSGLRRSRTTGGGRSRAIVGIATGASALVVAVLGVLLTVITLDIYDTYANPAPHDVAVTECARTGSRVTMTGELTNRAEETADFTVLVAFVRAGTNDTRSTGRVELTDVEPGTTVAFDVQRQVDIDNVDCEISEVTGPLPFGVTLD